MILRSCSSGSTAHRQRGFDPNRVIEYVSSHHWQYPGKHGPLSVHDFIWRHLSQAGTILTTSLRLLNMLRDECPRVFHAPNDFETTRFHRTRERTGLMRIGAAGFEGELGQRLWGNPHPCGQRISV